MSSSNVENALGHVWAVYVYMSCCLVKHADILTFISVHLPFSKEISKNMRPI